MIQTNSHSSLHILKHMVRREKCLGTVFLLLVNWLGMNRCVDSDQLTGSDRIWSEFGRCSMIYCSRSHVFERRYGRNRSCRCRSRADSDSDSVQRNFEEEDTETLGEFCERI